MIMLIIFKSLLKHNQFAENYKWTLDPLTAMPLIMYLMHLMGPLLYALFNTFLSGKLNDHNIFQSIDCCI